MSNQLLCYILTAMQVKFRVLLAFRKSTVYIWVFHHEEITHTYLLLY